MKKAALFFGLVSFVFASCTKEKCNPAGNNTSASTARNITVEYRITDVSSKVEIEYLAPENGSAALVSKKEAVNKTYTSIQFTSKSNMFYSITARNVETTTQDITVDIYVDGQLFKSGSLDHFTLTASASGKVE